MPHALLSHWTLGRTALKGPQRQLTLSRAMAGHQCHPTETAQAPTGPPEQQLAPAASETVSEHGEDAEQAAQFSKDTLIR